VAEIFISYRRDDSRDFAGAIRDKLGEAFERDRDGDALIYQSIRMRMIQFPMSHGPGGSRTSLNPPMSASSSSGQNGSLLSGVA
jgi:hypothetical protein